MAGGSDKRNDPLILFFLRRVSIEDQNDEPSAEDHWKASCRRVGLFVPTRTHFHKYRKNLSDVAAIFFIDIRTIQELLGQNSLKTALIYTYAASKNLDGVKSPLDLR